MSELIAVGAAAASSGDFTLAPGDQATLFLTAAADASLHGLDPGAWAEIQIKAASGKYITVGTLDRGTPALQVVAPGTYRVNKPAGASFGVDKV